MKAFLRRVLTVLMWLVVIVTVVYVAIISYQTLASAKTSTSTIESTVKNYPGRLIVKQKGTAVVTKAYESDMTWNSRVEDTIKKDDDIKYLQYGSKLTKVNKDDKLNIAGYVIEYSRGDNDKLEKDKRYLLQDKDRQYIFVPADCLEVKLAKKVDRQRYAFDISYRIKKDNKVEYKTVTHYAVATKDTYLYSTKYKKTKEFDKFGSETSKKYRIKKVKKGTKFKIDYIGYKDVFDKSSKGVKKAYVSLDGVFDNYDDVYDVIAGLKVSYFLNPKDIKIKTTLK